MTEAYRTTELEKATAEWQAARARFNQAEKYSPAWRKAAADVEFWSDKRAFLNVPAK